jgi:hypothetical protein
MKPIPRRDMLNQTGVVGTGGAVGLPLAQAVVEPSLPESHEAKRKLKVIVTAGIRATRNTGAAAPSPATATLVTKSFCFA